MTEPLIRESAPSSSVILAYGMAPQRSSWKTVVLVAATLFIAGSMSSLFWTLYGPSVPIPTSTSVLIAVSASEGLTDDAPSIWREAQARSRPFPVFLGRATDREGVSTAFAITPRTFAMDGVTNRRWIWQVLSEDPTLAATTTPLASLSRNPFSLPWMRIWPTRLGGASVLTAESVSGPLHTTSWNTDLPAPRDVASQQRLTRQNFLNLRALPNAWSYVAAILRIAGYDLTDIQPPATAEWSNDESGEFSASLHFDAPFTEEFRARLASVAGIYDRTEALLGDGSVIEKLDLPVALLKSSSSTVWTSEDGRRISFAENTAFFGDSHLASSTKKVPKACQNHVLAAFDQSVLGTFFSRLGILSTAEPQTIYWIEESGKVTLCWG